MIIIADGGSTKTNWCLIDDNQKRINFNTEGYNPYFIDTEKIVKSLQNSLPDNLAVDKITEVNYYGAGVHNEEKASIVEKALRVIFTNANLHVGHDLLAAAPYVLDGLMLGAGALPLHEHYTGTGDRK